MEREKSVGLFVNTSCGHKHLNEKSHRCLVGCLQSAGITAGTDNCVDVEATQPRHAKTDKVEKREVIEEMCHYVAQGKHCAGATVVRQSGHHEAMGYCLFNNVALTASALVLANIGVNRVLVVDWDVHGNGTQTMLWKDHRVLYFSIHTKDLFPQPELGDYDYFGEGSGDGFNIYVPWPSSNFGDADYLAAFDDVLLPVAQQFKPDMVLVSADIHVAKGDVKDIKCEVTPAGYSQMTQKLMGLAEGRVILAFEGGHHLPSLCNSYIACMKVLLGDPPEKIVSTKCQDSTSAVLRHVRQQLQTYWPVLSRNDEQAEVFADLAQETGASGHLQNSLPVDAENNEVTGRRYHVFFPTKAEEQEELAAGGPQLMDVSSGLGRSSNR